MADSHPTAQHTPNFLSEATSLADELSHLRRSLHQHPELGNYLPWTQNAVIEALEGLPLTIHRGTNVTSVTAVLEGKKPGPTVLLRGDMDALPVEENSGEEFASTNGAMHACGHDLHTAGLVGAAKLLSAHQSELPGKVIFMFQPGEEGPGGAAPMIEEGVLDVTGERPVAAYGFHVAPAPQGTFMHRSGTVMAGAYNLHVVVHGKGGHGSAPHSALDPVAPLTEIATAIQTAVTRQFNVFDPVVATITQLQAGTAAVNVIGDDARLGATVRAMTRESGDQFGVMIDRLAKGIAEAHGCTAEVEFTTLYPPTVCDAGETERSAERLRDVFGEDAVVEVPEPRMGSEDFSFVLEEVPGTFMFVGASYPIEDVWNQPMNHSAEVRFDDAVLPQQSAALATLAFGRLAEA
ncbi:MULTISPECIES: M20 metallopeptidase family protein [Micrococcales]|uniref:M20 metallopeptidase family protein n=1 Tax=Micrococcales TaxID=85006 RepID=UPI0006924E70|nr:MULTISPECIES: M20 family metallopeptidase [Micrococcales]